MSITQTKPQKTFGFVLNDFYAITDTELCASVGDTVEVLDVPGLESGWSMCKSKDGRIGYLPTTYIAIQTESPKESVSTVKEEEKQDELRKRRSRAYPIVPAKIKTPLTPTDELPEIFPEIKDEPTDDSQKRQSTALSKEEMERLYKAIVSGDVDSVSSMLDTYPFAITRVLNSEAPPLHLAAFYNQPKVIKLLLERGAAVNSKAEQMATPMHFAVSQGATDSIHVLVMNGGDVNMRDNAGNSSIHICIKCEKYEVLDDLILFGGDVNLKRFDGKTALHVACELGKLEGVKILISKDAKVNIKDEHGNTPLYFAARGRHHDIVRYLAKIKECNFQTRNSKNLNVLHIAVQKNDLDTVCIINEERSIDIPRLLTDQESENNYTPLHIAVINNNVSLVSKLLDLGADPNIQDKDGNTPLHIAVIQNNIELIRVIGKCPRCKLVIKNNGKKTAKALLKKDPVLKGIYKEITGKVSKSEPPTSTMSHKTTDHFSELREMWK